MCFFVSRFTVFFSFSSCFCKFIFFSCFPLLLLGCSHLWFLFVMNDELLYPLTVVYSCFLLVSEFSALHDGGDSLGHILCQKVGWPIVRQPYAHFGCRFFLPPPMLLLGYLYLWFLFVTNCYILNFYYFFLFRFFIGNLRMFMVSICDQLFHLYIFLLTSSRILSFSRHVGDFLEHILCQKVGWLVVRQPRAHFCWCYLLN